MTKEELLEMIDKRYPSNKIHVLSYCESEDEFFTEDTVVRNVDFGGKVKRKHICVYTNEGENIPHIHIESNSRGGVKFSCCVKLLSAEYFKHGTHLDELNNKQTKILDKVMRSRYSVDKTVWEQCVDVWKAHFETNIDIIKQPDYTLLNK